MGNKQKITGTVIYENISTGIWAIKDDQGNVWTPIEMPEQLKYKGKVVKVVAKKVDLMTSSMFGQPIEIISFETMRP